MFSAKNLLKTPLWVWFAKGRCEEGGEGVCVCVVLVHVWWVEAEWADASLSHQRIWEIKSQMSLIITQKVNFWRQSWLSFQSEVEMGPLWLSKFKNDNNKKNYKHQIVIHMHYIQILGKPSNCFVWDIHLFHYLLKIHICCLCALMRVYLIHERIIL